LFLEAARRLGVNPRDCQVFEDADAGLEAARRAGMLTTDVRPVLENGAGRVSRQASKG
jgi:beta-phosphoglucomutase-like phosphatase (HAD superfamily)